MRFHDEWQVRPRTDAPYRLVIANGPPDTETFDRRRVDPPAGCRAAAEPAILTGRRSTFGELKNNRRTTEYRIRSQTAVHVGEWMAVSASSGVNMTRTGRYEWHAPGMDLFGLANTIQADKERQIAEAGRRHRFLAELAGAVGMAAALRGAITGQPADRPRPSSEPRRRGAATSATSGSTVR